MYINILFLFLVACICLCANTLGSAYFCHVGSALCHTNPGKSLLSPAVSPTTGIRIIKVSSRKRFTPFGARESDGRGEKAWCRRQHFSLVVTNESGIYRWRGGEGHSKKRENRGLR